MIRKRHSHTSFWRRLPGFAGGGDCSLASSAIGPCSYEKVLVDGGFFTAADMRYHFFVTDHLGNVRVVMNDAGVVEQVNQFYPYGEATDMGQALPASVDNPYKWGGKEWDEDQGAYDFGARMYSAADARWTTMDPLCEKYYSISPYAYCAGNPVNLVDPDGKDVWEVDHYGIITWKEESDNHCLYYVDDDGNRGQGISVKNRDILDSFSSSYYEVYKKDNKYQRKERTGDRKSLKSLILQWKMVSSSYSSSSDDEDLMFLFVFLANSTSVEWSLHMNKDGITLGTCHKKENAGNESFLECNQKLNKAFTPIPMR